MRCLAIPASSSTWVDGDLSHSAARRFPELSFPGTKGQGRVDLRILPFGASIMSGVGSSTGDGLRRYLRVALRLYGWEVDMVGSLTSGQMEDANHEAVSGDIISVAHDRLPNSIGYKPNVVIINLGTNDAVRNVEVSRAGSRKE
ncbi:hypothetical protein V498_10156, partial [Pseudogymnoascus sp. VKM F-4517 (FW-2822)]